MKNGGEFLKVSSINLKESKRGIAKFSHCELGDVVILTGSNGSGKTRLLKILEQYVNDLHCGNIDKTIELKIVDEIGNEKDLDLSNAQQLRIVNYSHYDAHLQSPEKFTPYVIHKAKDLLNNCDYEETALNSLLFLYDMAMGYSDEFKDGTQFEMLRDTICKDFGIKIDIEETDGRKKFKLFDLDVEDSALSPGQQYLIRIAVACFQNKVENNTVFILDEPELHLHPKALIDVVCCLRETFKHSQFWISTHSLPLIAYLTANVKDTTVFNIKNGTPELFRSDSSNLLDGLIGCEDNQLAVQMVLSTPKEYASNKFSIECFDPPQTVAANPNDVQNQIIRQVLKPGDLIVDYGAGKGRFFEGLGIDYAKENIAKEIQYFAFDHDDKDAEKCKSIMNAYGATSENYFNDIGGLTEKVNSSADYVLLVNVLHEIDPQYWKEVFQNIDNLLKKDGKLIIVERSELTVGEAPYDNCFLVITQNSAHKLFGEKNVDYNTHPQKEYIARYTITKDGLKVTEDKINQCIQQIKHDSFEKIKSLKGEHANVSQKYKSGLKMAFWLNQYANASLIMEGKNNC